MERAIQRFSYYQTFSNPMSEYFCIAFHSIPKLVSAIFQQIFIFHQMKALQ